MNKVSVDPKSQPHTIIIIKRIRGEAVGAAWPFDFWTADGGNHIHFCLSFGSVRQSNVTLTLRAAGDSSVILATGLQGKVAEAEGWMEWLDYFLCTSPNLSMSLLAGHKIKWIIDQLDI